MLDNTTKDLEIETKDSLNEKINILSTLKEKVLSLEGLVYFGDEKEQFNNKTNEILKRYEEKIKQSGYSKDIICTVKYQSLTILSKHIFQR